MQNRVTQFVVGFFVILFLPTVQFAQGTFTYNLTVNKTDQ